MELAKINDVETDDASKIRRVLGENLKRLRESRGLSRNEFAKMFDLSPLTVRNSERGDISPKIPALVKYANFYNVSLDELLGRDSYVDKIIFDYRLETAKKIASQVAKMDTYKDEVIISETPEYSVVDAPRRTLAFSNEQAIAFYDRLVLEALNSHKTFQEVLNDKLDAIFGK